MPKFYGQNKKRIDPRYFMDEKLELKESQISEMMPPWHDPDAPEPDRHAQATDLAVGAMEKEMEMGVFDGKLPSGYSIIQLFADIVKATGIPGQKATQQRFKEFLTHIGVTLGEIPAAGSGVRVPESEAEKRTSGPDPAIAARRRAWAAEAGPEFEEYS